MHVEPCCGLRAAAQSDAAGVEASAPADENEMAEEKLPKGNSSGFFLDAPAMAQVPNPAP